MISIRISIRLHLAVDDEWVPADLVVADGLPINADASALSIVIEDSARVSKFFITDDLVGSWLPLPGWGVDDPQDLFDWVEQHRAELLGPVAAEPEDGDPMVELAVPFDELLGQLEVLAATGRDVLGGDPVVGWDD